MIAHRRLDYPVLPVLRADNAEVLIHPDDRKYGALLIGSMGSGKTAALLRMVLNDVRDENAAPIIIDPKSELAHLCLQLIPPECGKRVWFLDLGRPAFGMSPLRRAGERPLAIEATALAENVVAALSDISENQIFQSSRRYLYHAVIGALALAQREGRRPKFEDVYSLLRPAKNEFRDKVAEACADQPDLDQTAEFFRSELPDDLKAASASVTQRLDAPRNKISGLTGVPPLRRFFNHPSDIPLREIIEARDVLIVDANMAAIGTENSRACMHFLLRMLHTQLQRQVHSPEAERPRVPLVVDEAHYVADGENVVDQIATHRAAGLEVAFGLQYFAQLGSGSAHEEKIRKGVVNLLQSRFLFRIGDARDAEEATRIAMAVYATMIRDDPDSRARLRVTPEQALNFPNYHCLASWIAGGTRIPSFIGQTYRWPQASDQWADWHLDRMREEVGPYPEELASTLEPERPEDAEHANEQAEPRQPPSPPGVEPESKPASAPAGRKVRVEIEPPAPPPNLADSPVRRIVGKPASAQRDNRDTTSAPEEVRELAFFDRINEVGESDQLDGSRPSPSPLRGRLRDPQAARPRRPCTTGPDRPRDDARSQRQRRQRPAGQALPPRPRRAAHDRDPPAQPHRRLAAAAVLDHPPRPAGRPGKKARAGDLAQAGVAGDRAAPRRARAPRPPCPLLGDRLPPSSSASSPPTTGARPRYVTGRYPVPQVGSGHRRHPITVNEIPVPDGPGDDRSRAQDVRRSETRRLARGEGRDDQAHLRSARRARPDRTPLVQPREAARLRRLPVRMVPGAPAIQDA